MRAISIEGVKKSFGPVEALRKVSVGIDEGELFGFIGPDGAGKSTLFRLIVTLLIPDEGKVDVLGFDTVKDFKKIRRICGYMPQQFSLYQDLTVEENLRFFATAFGTTIKQNYHLIADIYSQIEPFKNRKAGQLSGGMKQKLALSCALIHKPSLLVLDEPTTGVDAISRKEFWEMLHRLKQGGLTIVVSTPYMDEASMCDRVALIQGGDILDINTPQGLRNSFSKKLLSIRGKNMFRILSAIREFGRGIEAHAAGDSLHCSYEGSATEVDELKGYLSTQGHEDLEIRELVPDIEDVFIEYMERKHG